MILVGPSFGSLKTIGSASGPMSSSSSSWQIFMKTSPGSTRCFAPLCLTLIWTISPSAFSLTRAMKVLATR